MIFHLIMWCHERLDTVHDKFLLLSCWLQVYCLLQASPQSYIWWCWLWLVVLFPYIACMWVRGYLTWSQHWLIQIWVHLGKALGLCNVLWSLLLISGIDWYLHHHFNVMNKCFVGIDKWWVCVCCGSLGRSKWREDCLAIRVWSQGRSRFQPRPAVWQEESWIDDEASPSFCSD
jgi:hypothetical protein